ncbi:MAG TPA: DUF2167 domain-containing protein [Gemmatimonadales bacterium]|nr:DUF2167 domain-containing protein [Gemmatimonadales bacterium]
MARFGWHVGCFLLCAGSLGVLQAQDRDSIKAAKFRSIRWTTGPATAALGDEATLRVPAACGFSGAGGTKTFMEITENPPTGDEVGMLLCREPHDTAFWFTIFEYDSSGYVRDDEGQSLDAAAILERLREGNGEGNKARRARGWDTLTIRGWQIPPHYDQQTHNLTWSMIVAAQSGAVSVNHSVRLLGRGGVMRVALVADPDQIATAVPAFNALLREYKFVPGKTYAEWHSGDKVAAYGLTALIAGGAGAVALKTGLLAKLGKLIAAAFVAAWKFLAAAAAAATAWLRSMFKRKGSGTPPTTPKDTP